ncbi:MotA/TolQ/ExbB proton channel family protein [Vibrio hippocampi]|uniref:Tol-Pal system protein TolQ n=1 Tax=Vibrio hippocampi TaxID=654686 RepID=A0ABM8ZKY5_9VIBR|nr:MotA/TolQ/ExbB proton channel family protein [Vibrio hippocampi]CAH0528913.1 Tol-Pal system protein TolQ [Vibrio hippocampi]
MLNDTWNIATGAPLVLCSAFAVALIFERLFFVMRKRGLTKPDNKLIFTALHEHKIKQALEVLGKSNTGYQFVVDELIHHKASDKEVRDEAIKIMLVRYSNQLKRRLSGLTTIASLAPMLGLLGTIVGLMRSFRDIGLSDGPVNPSIVADGLWQALSTTAAGMIIAVICVLCHALIQSRIRLHLTEAADVLNHFSHCIHIEEENQND